MKIAYAGFDLLYPMLESLYSNGCEIVKIFTNKVDNVFEYNEKVIAFANEHSIPITTEKITLQDLEELKEMGVEALFCAAYYHLVPILPDFKMVNVHPSLLPYGRGSWPMPLCIMNGVKESGVTFHKMAESFDCGDIILQKSFEIADDEDLNSFMEKVYTLIPVMVSELFSDFDGYFDNAKAQGYGEYQLSPDESDYVITKDTDFCDADRVTRAFYGFHTIYNDGENEHKLRFYKAVKGDNTNEKFKIKDGYLKDFSS